MGVKRLHPDAILPVYACAGDSGFDLHCLEDTLLAPEQTAIIRTGLAFQIPEGFEMQIRMRSGSALKLPLFLPNAPGTIDSGYRGEVGIIVRNLGREPCMLRKGQRIAQGVIVPVARAEIVEMDFLDESIRGEKGFGSSGE